MKIFYVDNLFPLHSRAAHDVHHIMSDTASQTERVGVASVGSESPRSLRDYHRGSGSLKGGGVQEVYTSTRPSIKKYKSKLDQRLGLCILTCLVMIATILCIYGLMHKPIHDELTQYVNRTHQIAQELKFAMDENYPLNNQSDNKNWMSVEELEDYAQLIASTNSALWSLFLWDLLIAVFLLPFVVIYHLKAAEGNLVKLVYRAVLGVCLLFLVGQFLWLIHPILWGAAKFPSMMDRLFVEAYPKDEYHLKDMEERFVCSFHPHETLVLYDIEQPCLPKMKNSLLPAYAVIMLIIIDLFPFFFAGFIYAWDACVKNSKVVRTARQRVELNNHRRVPFPRTNNYVPPDRKPVTVEELPGKLV